MSPGSWVILEVVWALFSSARALFLSPRTSSSFLLAAIYTQRQRDWKEKRDIYFFAFFLLRVVSPLGCGDEISEKGNNRQALHERAKHIRVCLTTRAVRERLSCCERASLQQSAAKCNSTQQKAKRWNIFHQKLLAQKEKKCSWMSRTGGKQEKGGREIAVLLNGEKSGCWHS